MYDNGSRGVLSLRSRVLTDSSMAGCDEVALREEIRQASIDVEARKLVWDLADHGYEEAAWHDFRAASERLSALLRQARQVVGA